MCACVLTYFNSIRLVSFISFAFDFFFHSLVSLLSVKSFFFSLKVLHCLVMNANALLHICVMIMPVETIEDDTLLLRFTKRKKNQLNDNRVAFDSRKIEWTSYLKQTIKFNNLNILQKQRIFLKKKITILIWGGLLICKHHIYSFRLPEQNSCIPIPIGILKWNFFW